MYYHITRVTSTTFVIKADSEKEAINTFEEFQTVCDSDDEEFAIYTETFDLDIYEAETPGSNVVFVDSSLKPKTLEDEE